MPDAAQKRAREHEAGTTDAAQPLDTDAAFKMLRKLLDAVRPQSKASRPAKDTFELIIEQWVEDANATEYKLDGERRTPYVPHLQKQLNQKQRWSARAEMRKTGSACKEAMAAVADAAAEEKPLLIALVRELQTRGGRKALVKRYEAQHEAADEPTAEADDAGVLLLARALAAGRRRTLEAERRIVRARLAGRDRSSASCALDPTARRHGLSGGGQAEHRIVRARLERRTGRSSASCALDHELIGTVQRVGVLASCTLYARSARKSVSAPIPHHPHKTHRHTRACAENETRHVSLAPRCHVSQSKHCPLPHA